MHIALDVAAVALYIAYSFESVLRLGDLVLDNMLYQVSKKYAEMAHVSVHLRHIPDPVRAGTHLC